MFFTRKNATGMATAAKTATRYQPLRQPPPVRPMIAFTAGGATNDALAPMTIMHVMATPRRATNQFPIVLCTASWPTIMVAALAMMPNTTK